MYIRRTGRGQGRDELCCFCEQQQEEVLERMEHAREKDGEHDDRDRESHCFPHVLGLRGGFLVWEQPRRAADHVWSFLLREASFWGGTRSLLQEEGVFQFFLAGL